MKLTPCAFKSNDNHGADGRFSSGGGQHHHEEEEPDVSAEDAEAFGKHDDAYATHTQNIQDLHDELADHLAKIEKLKAKIGTATSKAHGHFDALNAIRDKYGMESLEKGGSVLEHGEEIGDVLSEATHALGQVLGEKYGSSKRTAGGEDIFETAREFKFATDGMAPGEFKGYGAVFGNVDSHGDVIEPGAFKDSLAERKQQGRGFPPMHVMHGIMGGDGLPIGTWVDMHEDSKGLRVHGKISGMDTETGKLHFARVREGAYKGLSIGYGARDADRFAAGTRSDGAKRSLKRVHLFEISLVDDPSNAMSTFDELKSRLRHEAKEISASSPAADMPAAMAKAASSVRACIGLHSQCMGGSDSPTAAERADMYGHLQDAHEALTGAPARVRSSKRSAVAIGTEAKAVLDGLAHFSMPDL